MSTYQCTLCERNFKSSHALNAHKAFHNPVYANHHKTRKLNSDKTIILNKKRKEDAIKMYEASPNKCKQCNTTLPYDKRNNKFCNHSCCASFNNRGKQKSFETNNKISSTLKSHHYPHTKVKRCVCETCEIVYYYPKPESSKRVCSNKCRFPILSRNSRLHPKCGGQRKYKSHNYKGIHLDSSYELKVAMSLDEHKINWIRPTFMWYVDENGNKRRYYPDFYLPDHDVYLDPKNDYLIKTDTAKIQQAASQNNVRIVILDKDHLDWSSIQTIVVAPGNSAIPTFPV